jgi:hypothetical protein
MAERQICSRHFRVDRRAGDAYLVVLLDGGAED